jgi:hypothetical protein
MPYRMIPDYLLALWRQNLVFIGMTSGLTSGFLMYIEQVRGYFGLLGIVCTSLIALTVLTEKLSGHAVNLIRWIKTRRKKQHAQSHQDQDAEPS